MEAGIRQPVSVGPPHPALLGEARTAPGFHADSGGPGDPSPTQGSWTTYACPRLSSRGSQNCKACAGAGLFSLLFPLTLKGRDSLAPRNFQPTKDKEATFWKCAWRRGTGQKGKEGTLLPPRSPIGDSLCSIPTSASPLELADLGAETN